MGQGHRVRELKRIADLAQRVEAGLAEDTPRAVEEKSRAPGALQRSEGGRRDVQRGRIVLVCL